MAPETTEHWLDLSEAAAYLGVHFTTLRRWADAGQVSCIRTPGGRRRFAEADLERSLRAMRQPGRPVIPLESKALDLARQEIRAGYHAQSQMLAHFGEQQRSWFKYSGQALLGLLIQFSGRSESGDIFLDEARRLASEYGSVCFQAGMTVTETVRTFLFFSHSMLHTVQQAGSVNGPADEEGHRLYQRMSDFMDAILLATLESYCGGSQAPLAAQSSKG